MIINKMVSIVGPDEMTHYEPSHLDLHCLFRYLYLLKELSLLFFAVLKCYISLLGQYKSKFPLMHWLLLNIYICTTLNLFSNTVDSRYLELTYLE